MVSNIMCSKSFFLVVIILSGVTYLFMGPKGSAQNLDAREWFSWSQIRNDNSHTQTFKDMNSKVQNTRKNDIHTYCRVTRVPNPPANKTVNILYNGKYNLSSVIVPKIGSTFITQMFAVLKHGPIYAKYNLTTTRNKVKYTYAKQKLFLNSRSTKNVLTIVPTRNPFSRLYSAFVDKVYLPHGIKLGLEISSHKVGHNFKRVMKSGRYVSSGLSITFQDFLNYTLDTHVKRKTLQNHYEPIFPNLKILICNLTKFVIVKQETFETDMKYVQQSVGVDQREPETYNAIVRSLYESHIEDSIPGIIKDAFYRAQTEGDPKVWTGRIIAERLWHSFQLQGYISEFLPFPKRYFISEWNYSDVNFIVKIFLLEMKKKKLSRTESMKQRREAMTLAYKGVSEKVIRKLQMVYESDFQSFGYNLTLE